MSIINIPAPPLTIFVQLFKVKKSNWGNTALCWSSRQTVHSCFTDSGWLPVVNELCHEFEDRCGACWVVVPQLNGPLQNGHIGWISTGIDKEHSFFPSIFQNDLWQSSGQCCSALSCKDTSSRTASWSSSWRWRRTQCLAGLWLNPPKSSTGGDKRPNQNVFIKTKY